MALADQIFGQLTSLGYSPAQASGIIGNLQQESSLNPTASGDNGTAFGLGQWRGDRLTGLQSHAASMGLDPSDPKAQVSFLDWELKNKEPTAYKALMGAQDPQDAAAAFIHFERPRGYDPSDVTGSDGYGNRVKNALSTFQSLSGQPASTPTTTPTTGLLASGITPDTPADPNNPQAKQQPLSGLLGALGMDGQSQSASSPQMGLLRRRAMPKIQLASAQPRTFSF